MPVVVVESPAKAKTINKYLGSDYQVLASFGHVRDLPTQKGSVDPDNGFEMLWEVSSESKKHISAIVKALKSDNHLILATDPDREGEAISWHLEEALKARKVLKADTLVERVVFHSVTKTAVLEAIENPRAINRELVEAYLARRALDYLVGFNLSPVLWRKLPGSRSAGRVQSVCLRLIVDREAEIEAFEPREYWSISADMLNAQGTGFKARLVEYEGKKLGKYTIEDQAMAERAAEAIRASNLSVKGIEAKPVLRRPSPPFMTSTLQQEASRRLGFGVRQTMSLAQRLYEAGHITYMRTDGIGMAPAAISAAREAISAKFGAEYIPEKPRYYKNKAKNAQEAHECIRPTDMSKSPEHLSFADKDQMRLYALIWKCTLASQMADTKLERTVIDIEAAGGAVLLRASGQVMKFDGFLKVYERSQEDQGGEEEQARLPLLNQGEPLQTPTVTPEQHFTQPPARYSEASLVKHMEDLGIGRPSTYASVVTTIQERNYVRKEKNRLFPEDKGRLVTIFLKNYFAQYVEYDFTADLEAQLDDVSAGKQYYREVLDRFWPDFFSAVEETTQLRNTDVLEKINEIMGPYLFPASGDGEEDPRLCTKCQLGRLSVKTAARTGGVFIGCSNYPECRYTRPFAPPGDEADAITPEGQILGYDDNNQVITLRTGRFGPYVQRAEATEEKPKPDRASLPKAWPLAEINLEKALMLLSLPREIGLHPEDQEQIEAAIGRYGPYLRHGKLYANLSDVDEVFTVGMNRAVEILAEKRANPGRGRTTAKPLTEIGVHPEKGGKISVMDGRYGPYVKWEKINATLPREMAPESVTLEDALALIEKKAGAKGKKTSSKKTGTKKTTSKKASTKKAGSK